MKTTSLLARFACVISLGLAASAANAIPLLFEFSGTVRDTTNVANGQTVTTDLSALNMAFTAWISVETDGLVYQSIDSQYSTSHTFSDPATDSAVRISSAVTFGGVAYDAGSYYQYEGGWIAGADSKGPACQFCAYAADTVVVAHGSSQPPVPANVQGEYYTSRLRASLSSLADHFNLFDQTFQPTDVLSLPLDFVNLSFSHLTYTCGNGCVESASSNVNFDVTNWSVTSPQSVPEPATMALFAVGLLGTVVSRRAKRAS